MDPEIKFLISNQESLIELLSDAQKNYANSIENKINSSNTEIRNEALESMYEKFNKQHDKIEMAVKEEDKVQSTYFTEDLFEKFQDMYIKYKATMSVANSALVPKSSNKAANDSLPREMYPEIKLPRFAGGYENWLTFRSMYKLLIHENGNLSNFEKLYYLKNCLQGAAKNELKYIPTIEYNYERAWQRLNERYNNKQTNTNEVLKRLFAMKKMKACSSDDIRQIRLTTFACLASLKCLGIDVSSWDPIINHIVESKLDKESLENWMSEVVKLGPDELPTWDQMDKFLQNRSSLLEFLELHAVQRQNNF